jgi:hypothetical protein
MQPSRRSEGVLGQLSLTRSRNIQLMPHCWRNYGPRSRNLSVTTEMVFWKPGDDLERIFKKSKDVVSIVIPPSLPNAHLLVDTRLYLYLYEYHPSPPRQHPLQLDRLVRLHLIAGPPLGDQNNWTSRPSVTDGDTGDATRDDSSRPCCSSMRD